MNVFVHSIVLSGFWVLSTFTVYMLLFKFTVLHIEMGRCPAISESLPCIKSVCLTSAIITGGPCLPPLPLLSELASMAGDWGLGEEDLSLAMPRLWYSLPKEVCQACSLQIICRGLKATLFRQAVFIIGCLVIYLFYILVAVFLNCFYILDIFMWTVLSFPWRERKLAFKLKLK